jgi:hypothetical protein
MSTRLPPQTWKVRIAAHAVPPRWLIPSQTVRLPAPDAEDACLRAVRWAHADADVPPMRSLLRRSLQHATAKALSPSAVGEISRTVRPNSQGSRSAEAA